MGSLTAMEQALWLSLVLLCCMVIVLSVTVICLRSENSALREAINRDCSARKQRQMQMPVDLGAGHMRYPTMAEVESAEKRTLATWMRFLPSPGMSAVNRDYSKFHAALEQEAKILARIKERFDSMGGWTPALSKEVG